MAFFVQPKAVKRYDWSGVIIPLTYRQALHRGSFALRVFGQHDVI